MIASMTGYARQADKFPWGTVTWELRSVNHRFLEVAFRLPDACRVFEMAWRNQINDQLKRGKVDVMCRIQLAQDVKSIGTIDPVVLERLGQQLTQLQTQFPEASLSLTSLLQFPGLMESHDFDYAMVQADLDHGLSQALAQLRQMRQTEGQALVSFLQSHLTTMQLHIAEIEQRLPAVMTQVDTKLRARLDELDASLDEARLEQELVWYAQKIDVTEEIKRLHCHIDAFNTALEKGGVIGRRLDFLAQELNRETNTLASKSIDATVTHLALELKVLIEQMREQVQNIE